MDTTKKGGIPFHILMLAGFVIGLGAGLYVNLYVGAETPWVQTVTSSVTGPIGQLFLGLLFMLVLPLLFSAIVVGVAEMGDLGSLGRVGWKTLAMTVVISTIAVLIGLGMVNKASSPTHRSASISANSSSIWCRAMCSLPPPRTKCCRSWSSPSSSASDSLWCARRPPISFSSPSPACSK
jgi:Na+/H+-dicarboxylate symporter